MATPRAVRLATNYLVKRMHLRPVKSVKFVFDPYMRTSASIRDVMTVLHLPDVLESNQGTQLKIDIKSDRTQPRMEVEFNDGYRLLFKTSQLNQLEILDHFWEYVDEKDPKKHETPELITKSGKAAEKGKGKRR